MTNEVINYSYDAVNRLTGSGLSYDGFGNLLSGYSFSNLVVDGTTNRIMNTGYSYDLAGNLTAAPNLAAMSYNPEGRMTQIGTEVYRYGADGTRLMKGTLAAGQNTDVYFRDPWGRLRQVATYYRSPVNGYEQFTVGKRYDWFLWFLGKPVERGAQKWLGRDRLGSVRAVVTGGPSAWAVTTRTTYAPYGESNGAPTGTWGYGTYWREGNGLNYAEQRWYGVAGRFTTPDPYQASGGPGEPRSWNRYAYVGGDPVNYYDPRGMEGIPVGICDRNPNDPLCRISQPTVSPTFNVHALLDIGRQMQQQWQDARSKAYEAAQFIAGKKDWSDKCKQTLSDAGISPKAFSNGLEVDAVSQLRLAASAVTFFDGTVSASLLSDAYSGRPDLQRLVDQTQTIGQEFGAHGGTGAMAQLLGTSVWIRPSYFNFIGTGYAAAVVMHELMHNITGLTDSDLQRNLGLSDTVSSNNITLRLLWDCLF